ncbi:MAG: hypothetical protein HY481_00020 [Candidatus Vogelbacteria bacterium]|nr:hypothetical protein [Candidatus Vogelbacteria bacterium]
MIHLIYGQDRIKVRAAAEALLAAELKKYPELAVFRFSAEEFSLERLEETFIGQTLFEQEFAVVIDGLWPAAEKLFLKHLPNLSRSPNLYLFTELEVAPETIAQITAAGGLTQKVAGAGKSSPRAAGFNPFAVGDALGERHRQRAWILLQTALARGQRPEEIFWKLVWKVKTLLLVQTATRPAALGLKPFVLVQSRRHSRNFKLEELKKLSSRLVALWHDSRRGLIDFEHNLERLILEI